MAENDSHYNGTADPANMDNGNSMDGQMAPADESSNRMINPLPGMEGTAPDYSGSPGNNGSNFNTETASELSGENNSSYMGNDTRGITTIAVPWIPGLSSCPSCGTISPQSYGQVRFLNASTNGMTVNISIDGAIYALNSRFGTLSNYDWVSDGFHTVTVQRANGIRSTLLQQTFPFVADQKVTMVLTDSQEGGLEIIRVIDSGCRNLPAGSGCFRFANMTYSGSNLDLMLSGQTIFRNVRYQSVSSYKQAIAGVYQFSAVTAASYTFMRELPVIVVGIVGSSFTNRETIFTFHTRIQAGRNYTAYLIGNNWSNSPMQVIIAED